jgi:glycosyltransferase involved in cell wall biosynthesis
MDRPLKKVLVISAVNITQGGPLTILRECVASALALLSEGWDIYVLVHDKNLLNSHPSLKLMEFPKAKASWLNRLYYEWWYFYRLSQSLRPDLWLSLHDITPRVVAVRRAVYCHNPSPFYRISLREAWLDPRFLLFNLFYKYLYRIAIRQNDFVIVQQDWLRERFKELFGLKDNIIVAYPEITHIERVPKRAALSKKIFIYPAFPRVFKNIETACEAATKLTKSGVEDFELRLTIDGTENSYAKWIYKKYASNPAIKFLGLLDAQGMLKQYDVADCLIFPSKLETWGLPITEAKHYDLPILAADLPYAHETVGDYRDVSFFECGDADQLSGMMRAMIDNQVTFTGSTYTQPSPLFVRGWRELFDKIALN